jgi:hypothetical protein
MSIGGQGTRARRRITQGLAQPITRTHSLLHAGCQSPAQRPRARARMEGERGRQEALEGGLLLPGGRPSSSFPRGRQDALALPGNLPPRWSKAAVPGGARRPSRVEQGGLPGWSKAAFPGTRRHSPRTGVCVQTLHALRRGNLDASLAECSLWSVPLSSAPLCSDHSAALHRRLSVRTLYASVAALRTA